MTTVYGVGTVDGLNERGLAAHMLYLDGTNLGPRDPSRPGLQIGLWAQYLLDNAETVEEALGLLDTFQLMMIEVNGFAATVHLALEDVDGDSAIIEHIAGEREVHHGREYTVMTNAPAYSEQLRLLDLQVQQLQEQGHYQPSSNYPLPGNVRAVDRFQRAAYFSALLPQPKSDREAVAGVLAIARNASVPFGAPYADGRFAIYNTEYRTVCDLTDKRYFFELSTSPNLVWTELGRFDLSSGAPVMALNPDDINLTGDVSEKYTQAPDPFDPS